MCTVCNPSASVSDVTNTTGVIPVAAASTEPEGGASAVCRHPQTLHGDTRCAPAVSANLWLLWRRWEVVIRVIFRQDVHVTNTDGLMLQQQLPRTVAISAHKRGQLVQRHRLCVVNY